VKHTEIALGALFVAMLVGMAAFFIWRQWLSSRSRWCMDDLSSEDRRYSRSQLWRRTTCSLLMLALAVMLAVWLVLYGEPLSRLMAKGKPGSELDDEQTRLLGQSLTLVILMLMDLLGILVLAGWDLFAIRHYGRRHMRQIQADRRAMLEDQISRVRSERNGHSYR
jgi:H+/gluconate symporter-like permease